MKMHERDEISAHLDGEAADPAWVEERLRDDPEAAEYHRQLKDASAHLRRLHPPSVNPAFTTRVMALAAEEGAPRRRGFLVALPVAAALLVMVLAFWFVPGLVKEEADPDGFTISELENQSIPGQMRTLEGIEDYPDPELGLWEPYPADSSEYQIAYAGMLADGLLDAMEEVLWASADLDTMIDSLSQDEAQAFRQSLAEYSRKG